MHEVAGIRSGYCSNGMNATHDRDACSLVPRTASAIGCEQRARRRSFAQPSVTSSAEQGLPGSLREHQMRLDLQARCNVGHAVVSEISYVHAFLSGHSIAETLFSTGASI